MHAGVELLLDVVIAISAHAQSAADKNLDAAIAGLRNINSDKLSEVQKETKAKEIDKAWETIRAAGKDGTLKLKQEIQQLD